MKQEKGRKRPQGPTPPTEPSVAPIHVWLAWAAILIVYVALRVHMVGIPLERDEGLFGYIGQLVRDGGVPYRDAIDHKPPLVYFIYALGLTVAPATATGVHVFLHAYNFLTLVAMFFLARTSFASLSTGLWAAGAYAVLSASPSVQGFTASTEMFLLLPATLGLLLAVRAARSGNLGAWAGSGICAALVCWTKHSGAFLALFTLVYAVAALAAGVRARKLTVARAAAALAVWGGGGLAVSLGIVAYFYLAGAFDAFASWVFTFNYAYSATRPMSVTLQLVASHLREITAGNAALFTAAALGIVGAAARKDLRSASFATGFLVFSLLSTVPGFSYSHYFAQIVPAVALAAGMGLSWLFLLPRTTAARAAMAVILAALSLGVPVYTDWDYYYRASPLELSRDSFGINPFPESPAIARLIEQGSLRSDHVFIFGSEAQILFYAKRKSPSPFVLMYPLMRNTYPNYLEYQKQAADTVERELPRYIVTVGLEASLLWDHQAEMLLLNRIRALVARAYELEAIVPLGLTEVRVLTGAELKGPEAKDPAVLLFKRK